MCKYATVCKANILNKTRGKDENMTSEAEIASKGPF